MKLLLLLLSASLLAMTGSGLVGGYRKHENHQNDERVSEIATFAVEQISSQEGKKLDLVKVISVSTQVVAGKNYKLVLETATPNQQLQPYEATVYGKSALTPKLAPCTKAWYDVSQCTAEPLGGQQLQLTEHKAVDKANAENASEQSSERQSGALLGGYKEVDAQDSEAQEAAQFAAKQISDQSNSLLPYELKDVLQAKQKVANGKVWELKLELVQGKQGAQVFEVEVARSLQNKFTLEKVTQV